MQEVADYLMKNYYKRYPYCKEHPEMIPTNELLFKALDINKDKVVVVTHEETILGAAIFLTLSDETYEKIENIDLTKVDVLIELLAEKGKNIHFILVAGEGIKVLLSGVHAVIDKHNPKTVSWWSPDMSHLHKYNMN